MNARAAFNRQFSIANAYETYLEKVRYRAGKGTDGTDEKQFRQHIAANVSLLIRKVKTLTYKFTPYKAALLLRGPKKLPRQVEKPTIRDKLVLRLLYNYLYEVYQDSLEPRKLHRQVKELVRCYHEGSLPMVLRFDVKDFYPSIDHRLLLRSVRRTIRTKEIIALINSAIKTPTDLAKRQGILQNERGVPQGLSISNVLSNIYLIRFDQKYTTLDEIKYFRYVDDILILCSPDNRNTIAASISSDLRKRKLKLNISEKHTVTDIHGDFDYLGYRFHDGIVTVRKKSVQKMHDSLMKILSSYKYSSSKSINQLMFRLNLRITGCILDSKKYGWMFFFSQTNDEKLLHSLDHFTLAQLRRYGLTDVSSKKFVRTWHEINSNFRMTNYIPNFDEYSIAQKVEVLSWFNKTSEDEHEIRYMFKDIIYREIIDLERDMAEFS